MAMTMTTDNADVAALSHDEIHLRRIEEVEALLSYYGEDDFKYSLDDFIHSSSSSTTTSVTDDKDGFSSSSRIPSLDSPWFLRLRLSDDNNNNSNLNCDAFLELRMPSDYPMGSTPPTPIILLHIQNHSTQNRLATPIHSYSNSKQQQQQLFLQKLQDEYVEGTCVGIYWGECCRAFLLESIVSSSSSSSIATTSSSSSSSPRQQVELTKCNEGNCGGDGDGIMPSSLSVNASSGNNNNNHINHHHNRVDVLARKNETTIPFLPATTRFHQPVRHFPSSIITNPLYQCQIHRTPPFRPPNSGASECLVAHVARVTRQEHVLWTLGQLLLCDKKVSKASHNMFAYRYFTSPSSKNDDIGGGGSEGGGRRSNRGGVPVLVSDHDDDGEKGAGKKLSALLELCHAENVLVVVSRWFGGELLGAARFKWIASVAKDGLVQAGIV